MSINEFNPYRVGDVSEEIGRNISGRPNLNDLHDGPSLSNASNSPQSSTASAFNAPISQPDTTANIPPANTTQSTPHRVWEPGYQSPFARLDHPIQPLPIRPSNPQSSSIAVNAGTSQYPEGMSQRTRSYRVPKVVTKEITLNDIDASTMVTLGLSPFMVGQDAIANRNRFVRNECILARQFIWLRRTATEADKRHSQTEQEIYNHLERHKATLDMLSNQSRSDALASNSTGTFPAGADSDFLALEKAHQETCARLDALSQQVAEYSQATQRALVDLAQRLEQIIRTGAYVANQDAIPRSPSTAPSSFSPLILSRSSSNLKRKWDSSADSILGSPSTMPPPTPDFRNSHLSGPQ